MNEGRRKFLKIAGISGGALMTGSVCSAKTSLKNTKSEDFYGMLIDTTQCIGCRSCEIACNEANQLPQPEKSFDDESVFENERKTDVGVYTVVNRYPNSANENEPVYRRLQCMHCNQPACASACLVKAMEKTKEGPIIYHPELCLGCRYCMVACPFDIPKFEYDKPVPSITKCIFCYERIKEGKKPACAEACPTEATLFGKRSELVEIAKTRIYQNPDNYVHHIYGENEVGGTGWIYLSSVPFEEIGFRTDLGTRPYPEFTYSFLSAVPFVLILWPALLMGISYMEKRKDK